MSGNAFKAMSLSVMIAAATGFAAQGLTVFHIGNSLTDETYRMHNIAEGFGYTWPGVVYARSMIPGCPLHLLWSENVKKTADKSTGNAGFFLEATKPGGWEEWIDAKYPTLWSPTLYLNAKPFDAVVMQVFPGNGDSYTNAGTLAGALGYPGEAYKSNPNCQAYIYPSHTMDVGKQCDLTEYTRIYEPLAKAVTAKYPTRKPACIIPVLQVWNQMMTAGYTDLWASATDGHANEKGKYILCVTFYATLYKKDPAGATITGFTGLDQAFATKVQQVAWSVVQSYAMSGVGTVDVAKTALVQPAVKVSSAQTKTVDLAGRSVAGNRRDVAGRSMVVSGGVVKATMKR